MRVVATAGHVDHGKSSLVLALTGTDPDRWAEEKRRGLTIDLGFAHTTLPSGEGVSFVDVPGHVRFLRNMLAGVGAVDACMFVVAATEGWKPQSEEHLRILQLLGLGDGLVALTKSDLVDDEWLELARIDVADHVAGTFLEGAPIVAVSAATGSGLHDIRTELDELVARTSPAPDQDRPRLWIDRVFAAKGSGTVVTGTLTGGRLAVNDRVVVGPAGREARIRAIQSLGSAFDSIGPGNRVALNLAGLDHSEVARGHAVTFAAQWRPTKTLDVSLSVLADVAHDVNRRGAYVVYLGSGEHPARLRVLGPDSITAGGQGLVRLHVGTPVPLLPGDRFILRESGRDETIGGGEVLDVAPVRRASRARPDRSVDRVIEEREWVDVDELWALTGERRDPQVGRWVGAPGRLDALQDELRTRVRESGALGLDVAVLDEREREVLKLLDDLRVDGGRIRPVQAKDTLAEHPVVDALRAGGFVPAPPDGVDRGVLRELSRRGVLVERDGVWFHANAIEAAARVAAQLLSESPEGFTVAEFRDAIGASRKHALPLVNELDARGITRRRDDRRIAGPRIPSP